MNILDRVMIILNVAVFNKTGNSISKNDQIEISKLNGRYKLECNTACVDFDDSYARIDELIEAIKNTYTQNIRNLVSNE